MTDKTKPVTIADERATIKACCAAARNQLTRAVPSFYAGQGAGYVLENDTPGCNCSPRYIKHDWTRLGHAEFVEA